MSAAGIVEAVDVSEESDFHLSAGLPIAAPDQFGLQRLEEAFDGGIVVTVALPAHRWLESVVAQKLLIMMCAVLRPTIGVMNAAWWWSADRNRHVQRPECQILFYAVTDGPADHTPRKQIKNNSQIDPNHRENDPPERFLILQTLRDANCIPLELVAVYRCYT